MKVLHLDVNHPLIIEQFNALGFENHEEYTTTKSEIEKSIHNYDGLIIRSRFSLDKTFLEKATKLKFIGRLGAGLENIDTQFAKQQGIFLAAAPEGNRNAVGEHTLGMLLSLFNNLNKANRGLELDGKTVGIIGYGNMGKAFAKKLKGFDVEVLCYDIKGGVEDDNARQVGIMELQQKTEILSLHVPQTEETIGMINTEFISKFHHPFWILNTARGKCINTEDLVSALKTGKLLGAGLDVLEYEKASFEDLFKSNDSDTENSKKPEAFQELLGMSNVLLSPHVAGWTIESKEKLAQTVVNKIKDHFIV